METPLSCSQRTLVSPAQEPKQLVHDRLEMNFFRRDEGEGLAQRITRLRAENGKRARAGAVRLGFSVLKDEPQEIVILVHLIFGG